MKITFVLFLLFAVFDSFGQLLTTTYPSPIIGQGQGDFLGANYNVISSTFTGAYYSIGHFDATNTTLGVNKGLMLTTGVVIDNGFGPHGPNDLVGCSTNNYFPADTSITDLYLSGQNVASDMSKLEIEFIPSIDSLKMKFVFASEEYPCPSFNYFNDFFAVQLFKNDTVLVDNNIGRLPNGSLVSVQKINNGFENNGPCSNCAFYQQNGIGDNLPYSQNNQYVQFDGFTKDTYIFANNLEIGTTYKMVFYLTDVGDGLGDSAVFLESCESCDFQVNTEEINDSNLTYKVFPNPTKHTFTIEAEIHTEYNLLDANGKTLLNGTLNQTKEVISIENIAPGVYYVRLKKDNSSQLEKLVID